ncbi:VC0807 family protein [Actinacidiphila rubida]|uniref:Intracellular septation protein A n=1 Tax=Actinacidiphila rubida TaxID=310780 RepID=A0A1H8DRA9_9ACTN|nr:VC0807 family protein [Actinacidiphila rubida]SEN09394.1 Intracellular septation protein A [Actinacidiphila rubida]
MTDARTADTAADSGRGDGRGKALLLIWGPTVLFSMVLPWVTYNQLSARGVPEVPALLIISAWPALEIGLYFALHRRVDEFGMLILLTLLLGAAGALAYNSSKMIFLKDSALTGLVGLAFLVSLALRRPLIFYFGRRFATDGTEAGVARWNGMWDAYPGFRAVQRRLTVIWGVAFLAEATVKAVLVYHLSTGTMVSFSSVMPLAVTALLVAYTVRTGKKGEARRAAAEAAAGVQTPAAPSNTPTA